jgi:hypothetical protein
MATSPGRAAASAEPCADHPECIRFHRPDGAINEAGEWHAQWRQNAWHVRGPDPADAGFPMLSGPIDRSVPADPDANPIEALRPYVGDDALRAALNVRLSSDEDPSPSGA